MAAEPYVAAVPPIPKSLGRLDFDAWRQIRFRPEKTLFKDDTGGDFRLQAMHLGHLFGRPIALHVGQEVIPYESAFFDYGPNQFDPPLPEDLGFAGWRINYPLNRPGVPDELVSFLGASYFRFLGRGQSYGLSARALSIGSGKLDNMEEFPFFREFWFQPPGPASSRITFVGLLDSPSLAGAYQFVLKPGVISTMEISASIHARRRLTDVGLAPLTSMYFIGENDRHMNDRNKYDDYRPELHDSDGLLMHGSDGKWRWRPLRNPQVQEVSYFHENGVENPFLGFGLLQRDRDFSHYGDIELSYQTRPSYWVEPLSDWGAGRIELIELATKDETADNIVVSFLPSTPIEPGAPFDYDYRISSGLDLTHLSPLAYVANTFHAPSGALGSKESRIPGSRRFLVDFKGGDLPGRIANPAGMDVVASVAGGQLLRSFLVANPAGEGFRVFLDIRGEPTQSVHLKAYLAAGETRLSETWQYRWKVE